MVKLIAKAARIDRLKANNLMRMFKPTCKASGTLTTPATATKSMGLPALALAPMVFAVTRVFHREFKIMLLLNAKQKPFTPRLVGN